MFATPWPATADPVQDLDHLLGQADPTAIWVSVSGGIDSDAAAIWARRRWPHLPLILWHAHLAEMDWAATAAHLDTLAATLGNATRMTRQAVYERTGALTASGCHALRLRRSHDVDRFGPAQDDDPAAVRTLWDLVAARNGQPPTKALRYCTSYLKSQLCDHDLRAARAQLGARPLLISGERWAESPQRALVAPAEWRVPLQPSRSRPSGHRVLWLRPLIRCQLHEVAALSLQAGMPFHPGYFLQGETLASLLDPTRDERGRARLSCVTCIFSAQHHIQAAYDADPVLIAPYVARVQDYEAASGMTWQQRGPLEILLHA